MRLPSVGRPLVAKEGAASILLMLSGLSAGFCRAFITGLDDVSGAYLAVPSVLPPSANWRVTDGPKDSVSLE
jgi:hypothetical protein